MKYLDTYLVVSMDFDGEYEFHGSFTEEKYAIEIVDFLSSDDTYKDVWIEDNLVKVG